MNGMQHTIHIRSQRGFTAIRINTAGLQSPNFLGNVRILAAIYHDFNRMRWTTITIDLICIILIRRAIIYSDDIILNAGRYRIRHS